MPSGYSSLMSRRGGLHRPPRPPVRWGLVAILVIAALVAAGVLYVLSSLGIAVSKSYTPVAQEVAPEVRAAPVQPGERVNILFMALDDQEVRTDVMILGSIDLEQKKAAAIQIPRDTRAFLAGEGTIEKINHAFAYGVRDGDEAFPPNLRSLKTVEALLGVRIHYTVVVDMDAFTRAIDEIGGVEVDIPFVMDYDDPYQDLHIHFNPGRQILNGQQALEFVRWRHNNDGTGYPDQDLGRIRAQQQFIRTVLEQVTRPGNLVKLPGLIQVLAGYVESTIEPARLASLAAMATSIDVNNIEMVTLPGIDAMLLDPKTGLRSSYFVHDPAATRQLVDRLVHGIDPDQAAQVQVEVAAAPGDPRAAAVVNRMVEQGFRAKLVLPPEELPSVVRVVPNGQGKEQSLLVARSLMAQGYPVELVTEKAPETAGAVRVILNPAQEEPADADGIR